ncbi:MFS transporter [Roseomonas sp. SSH11]|uniref:MFS transporter n=1 Tax=Pararoseomonas baculiformis TaxID=2820812 RepID=A0ABS4AH70_9PROT|nr:MFS transporter [Pararoseomonas baculiformis]MBP0446216.1 MFS transporter [Pararoseomonas baculiformis]
MQGRPLAILLMLAVACAALAMGLRQSFGLYLAPMTTALGWSTSGFALAIAIQVLVNGFSQPIVGQLADRYGGRVVVIGGALLYAAGIAGMALSPGLGTFTFFAGLVLGVAVSAAGMPIIVASLTRQLPDSMRGRAAALGTAGSSMGQFLVVPLSGAALSGFGWQMALLAMAVAALLMVPLALPLAGRPAPKPASEAPEESAREALSRALGSRLFWCLFFGFFVCGLHVSFLAVHMPGFVASCHLPLQVGAWSISLIGLFNIVGSLGAGELTQRWRRRELLVAIYGLRALVMAVFFLGMEKTTGSVLVFSAFMGVLWLSTVPPTVALCARLFGTRWLATIFGLVFLGHQIGGFIGAWLPGLIFDRTGTYDAMWYISIAAGIFAALIHLPVREPAPAVKPATA